MKLTDAISLIEKIGFTEGPPQTWADLGAGEGLFSRALLQILPTGSVVHAVDRQHISIDGADTRIIFHHADFVTHDLALPPLDGLLLANSLHYVKDPIACLQRLKKYLRDDNGKIVLIEYDTNRSNQWVPFPISFACAQQIVQAAGLRMMRKIGEHPSAFRRENIYSALIMQ